MSEREDSILHYGEGTERLSQLSDIVSLSQENDTSQKLHLRSQSLPYGPESILDLVETLPSQAILPTPEIPFASQRNDTSGASESRDISNEPAAETRKMPSDDERAYLPESNKCSRRATRRGYAAHFCLLLASKRAL